MKIIIEGESKEIADLVLAVQGQPEDYVALLAEGLKDAIQLPTVDNERAFLKACREVIKSQRHSF